MMLIGDVFLSVWTVAVAPYSYPHVDNAIYGLVTHKIEGSIHNFLQKVQRLSSKKPNKKHWMPRKWTSNLFFYISLLVTTKRASDKSPAQEPSYVISLPRSSSYISCRCRKYMDHYDRHQVASLLVFSSRVLRLLLD